MINVSGLYLLTPSQNEITLKTDFSDFTFWLKREHNLQNSAIKIKIRKLKALRRKVHFWNVMNANNAYKTIFPSKAVKHKGKITKAEYIGQYFHKNLPISKDDIKRFFKFFEEFIKNQGSDLIIMVAGYTSFK